LGPIKSQQLALGTVDPHQSALVIDLVVGNRSVFEQPAETLLAVTQCPLGLAVRRNVAEHQNRIRRVVTKHPSAHFEVNAPAIGPLQSRQYTSQRPILFDELPEELRTGRCEAY